MKVTRAAITRIAAFWREFGNEIWIVVLIVAYIISVWLAVQALGDG